MEVGQVADRWRTLKLLLTGAALFALVVLGTGCDEGDVEEVLGDISAASIESAYPVDEDPLINDWLTNRGHTIVSHTSRQNIPYEFSVVETDLVNAFAAPYGHVYVTTGFLDFADTEDEVAVVLAHEVGHIVNRDSIHSFKNSILWGVVTQIISGKSRTAGDVLGIGLGLLSLQYSRDAEYAADDAGTRYAYAVGYDPARGLDFFNRLMTDVEKRRPSRWEVYFSTHPRTEDRIARQLKRDEMSDSSSEPLLRIARGYLLRGQPAKASVLLEKGLKLEPDLPEAQTLLGDALARRGDRAGARAAYEQALRLSSGLRYAQTRLAALPELPPATLPGIPAEGRQRAAALLAELPQINAIADETALSVSSYSVQTDARLDGIAGMVRGINSRLLDLADDDTEVSEETRDLVSLGNSAIARATEAVYVLERVNDTLQASSAEMQLAVEDARTSLQRAQAGEGSPEDIRALEVTLRELQLGADTLDEAMAESPATLGEVESAQASARDVTDLLEMVVRLNDPHDLTADQLRSAASRTDTLATKAMDSVRRAKQQSIKANGHALVARLNLLGARATPAQQEVFDAQIAHMMLVPEAAVRSLRAEGAGYGEAALALATAKSLSMEPGRFVPSTDGSMSLVNEAVARRAAVSNASVLLKFLASSMQAERDAQAAG